MKCMLCAVLMICLTISCYKGAADDPDPEVYARFDAAEETVDGLSAHVEIIVKWSKTEWDLSTDPNGFITELSATSGGDNESANTLTIITLSLETNEGQIERSQDIILTNRSSGEESTMSIVQHGISVVAITLDASFKHQYVRGFGGMLNPAVWLGNNQLTEQEIEQLYGENGLGYNMIRMMIYPDPNQWDRDVAIARKTQELGATVFASPWTPPVHMKTNGELHNEDGGSLIPEMYGDYANHLKAFVDYQQQNGVNLYAVSIQNEPDWRVSYDGCSWTPQQLVTFVTEYGRSVGDGVKLIAGETVGFNKSYTDPILQDPVAVNNFDIVGAHLYGSGMTDDALAQEKGKEVWMTEKLFNSEENGYDWEWIPSLKTTLGKEIHDCMVHNYNAYVWWYLKRYYSMLGDSDPKSLVGLGEISKRGYILGHYAKYATGRTRIHAASSSPDDVLVTAYEGTDDITLVLLNMSTLPVRVDIPSATVIGAVSGVWTDATNNMENITSMLTDDKKTAGVLVPRESIVSIRLQF